MLQTIPHVKIAGVNASVPDNFVTIKELLQDADKETRQKIRRVATFAGLHKRPIALDETTVKDLAITAAEALLNKLNWQRNSIKMLTFVTQTPYSIMPSNAYFVHNALQLSSYCSVLDSVAACGGLIQGIFQVASHINPQNKRALVFAGDTLSKTFFKEDIGNQILFGDAVGLVALEYSENPEDCIHFNMTSYPDMARDLTFLEKDTGFFMRGNEVMDFTSIRPAENINELLIYTSQHIENIDIFFSHQPSMFLLQTVAESINLAMDKMPISIQEYGNCSSASLALTMAHYFASHTNTCYNNALFCGFGAGFSVASMLTKICAENVFSVELYS